MHLWQIRKRRLLRDGVAQMILYSNAEAIRGRGATFCREDIKKHFGVKE